MDTYGEMLCDSQDLNLRTALAKLHLSDTEWLRSGDCERNGIDKDEGCVKGKLLPPSVVTLHSDQSFG